MYANNCFYLVQELLSKEESEGEDKEVRYAIDLDKESDIIAGVVITRDAM